MRWGIKHSLFIRLLLRITFAHIMGRSALVVLTLAAFTRLAYGVSSQSYTWKNVKIGGGGGFGGGGTPGGQPNRAARRKKK